MSNVGKFITFEGGEGAGKSTQLKNLAEHLTKLGRKVICLREPGGTPLGEQLRTVLKSPASKSMKAETEALLFASSRAQLVGEVIIPALKEGTYVLCDRFVDSTIAYQSGGRGLDRKLVESVNRLACGILVPDLTVFLDLDPAQGLLRASTRDQGQADRFELLDNGFHQKVREVYQSLVAQEPQRFLVLDATKSPSELDKAIWHEVTRRFL
jgi:dTMP kinase